MILVKRRYFLLALLGFCLALARPALALTDEQQAEAIINASPVVQKIRQSFKADYGNLSFFVEGLTGSLSELPSAKREWSNNDIMPFIRGGKRSFKGGGSLSRIMVLLDQEGRAKSVVSERSVTVPGEFIDAISDTQHLKLSSANFLDSTIDLSSFDQLKRLDIAFSENAEQIILPKSGRVEKIILFQEGLKRVTNLGRQKSLSLFKSTAEKAKGLDELNGNPFLKNVYIHLADSSLDIGSLTNLEKLWVEAPRYENISKLSKLDRLELLMLDGLSGDGFSNIVFPKNIKKISMYNIGSNNFPKIQDLPKLKQLVLHSIKDDIFKNTQNLPSLQELLILGSNLPVLNGIEKLPSLKKITIKNSNIVDASALVKLPNLKKVFLQNNNLEEINVVSKMPWLEIIDVTFNRLRILPKLQPGNSLKRISFSYNPIETIDPEVLKSYSNVQKFPFETPYYNNLTKKQRLNF